MKVTKETNMKWYSVKSKLPKHNTDVLALHSSGQKYVLRFSDNTIYTPVYTWASIEQHGVFVNGITHWQKLPSSPKEKK